MPEQDGEEVTQYGNLECDRCGAEADLGMGYGEMHRVECPDCGDEWVVEPYA